MASPQVQNNQRWFVIYHFCRMQLPAIGVPSAALERHSQRTFDLYRAKNDGAASWENYWENFYPLDWYLAVGCLESDPRAWDMLFAARASRTDCLLVDALRARAVRLYPRDEERQDSAVTEFWSQLLVSETAGGQPILAKYDGQRPLVPWLIRVFQNLHVSKIRKTKGQQPWPDDDLALPLPEPAADGHWHESFCLAARAFFGELTDTELLILGLRLRYRLSQREAAHLLGVHEGTVSRQTTELNRRCQEFIGRQLLDQGWTGEGLDDLIRTEMAGLLVDEPRLAADQLARLLAARGKALPPEPAVERA